MTGYEACILGLEAALELKKKKLDVYIRVCLALHFGSAFEKNWNFLFFSLIQINIFLMFSDHFDVLMSKMI